MRHNKRRCHQTLDFFFLDNISFKLIYFGCIRQQQVLSSPTRDGSSPPCTGSMESQPLDHQGGPYILCIYFGPCWVFLAVRVFSLIEASRGCSLVAVCRLLTAVASRWGAQIGDQGLNPCSLVAQLVKNPPAMRETWVPTHSSILA